MTTVPEGSQRSLRYGIIHSVRTVVTLGAVSALLFFPQWVSASTATGGYLSPLYGCGRQSSLTQFSYAGLAVKGGGGLRILQDWPDNWWIKLWKWSRGLKNSHASERGSVRIWTVSWLLPTWHKLAKLGKRESQLRKCLHQTVLWALPVEYFLNC